MLSTSSAVAGRASSTNGARTIAKHNVRAEDVSKVLTHRLHYGREQYLVRWKTTPEFPVPPRAPCSWHDVEELVTALHHVQTYIETLPKRTVQSHAINGTAVAVPTRKRKSPGSDPVSSRESSSFTPRDSVAVSREQSVLSLGSSSEASNEVQDVPEVYNGTLQRREGRIIMKASTRPGVAQINPNKLPNPQMLEAAAHAPTGTAEHLIREAFNAKLKKVKKVRWENGVDGSAPSLNFTFIKESILRDGTYRVDPEANVGCQKPCKPNMGQNIGCEYPRLCSCLEYAAVNEPVLEREDQERYEVYLEQKNSTSFLATEGLPKRFPYQKPNPKNLNAPSTLQSFYLDTRHPIYECSQNCNCGSVCKSRVVQKRRKVPLVIFKTPNRGWGVYCDEELIRGEFVDTYIGEIITNEEAEHRENIAGKDKASYLYSLDKFVGDDPDLTNETCFVVDGEYMGGPTRFINHCCGPNCRQYTVSYNRYDLRVYDIAFFAIENIPRGTELTFDYMDKDEAEEEDVVRERERAAADPENEDKKPCNCGARKCRGFLWV